MNEREIVCVWCANGEKPIYHNPDGRLDSPTCGHQQFPHPGESYRGMKKGRSFNLKTLWTSQSS